MWQRCPNIFHFRIFVNSCFYNCVCKPIQEFIVIPVRTRLKSLVCTCIIPNFQLYGRYNLVIRGWKENVQQLSITAALPFPIVSWTQWLPPWEHQDALFSIPINFHCCERDIVMPWIPMVISKVHSQQGFYLIKQVFRCSKDILSLTGL